jgi:hypothetical protein
VFAALLLAGMPSADAAPVTLLCEAVPGLSYVSDEPDTLTVDEAAGTVDFMAGAMHFVQANAVAAHHVGTFPATFSQNEITFNGGDQVYRLNRLSGRFSQYTEDGVHTDRDMNCHIQQRQF